MQHGTLSVALGMYGGLSASFIIVFTHSAADSLFSDWFNFYNPVGPSPPSAAPLRH